MLNKRSGERRSIVNRRAVRTDRRVTDIIDLPGRRKRDLDRRLYERRFKHRRIQDWVNITLV